MANDKQQPQVNLDDDVEVLNTTLADHQHAIALAIREIRALKGRVTALEAMLNTGTTSTAN